MKDKRKLFAFSLTHDKGVKYCKTFSFTDEEQLIKSVMENEGCPRSAIVVKRIPKGCWGLPAEQLLEDNRN